MPVRRDLRLLSAIAVLGVAIALAATVSGLDTGLLLLSPALSLLLPLLAGRYLGADTLERLAARGTAPRRRRRAAVAPLPRHRPRATLIRGGRLLASARAERGPPPVAAAG